MSYKSRRHLYKWSRLKDKFNEQRRNQAETPRCADVLNNYFHDLGGMRARLNRLEQLERLRQAVSAQVSDPVSAMKAYSKLRAMLDGA